MTLLTKTISRETAKSYQGRAVIVSLSPAGGSQQEALIGFRLKGKRTTYISALSDCYRRAALDYGNKMAIAKRAARKSGQKWKQAKREFVKANSL